MSHIVAKKSQLQKLFPDTRIAAYYDPFSQIINLCKYNREDFENLASDSLSSSSIQKLSLFEHELTHWLDHISTLWGQKNLVCIYNALNARASGNIYEFWRIKSLFINYKGGDFFDYFSEEYEYAPKTPKTPWKYRVSSGIRFSESGKPELDKPILFVRFSSFDDLPLIRVPVSVASLLESNAIYAEYSLKIAAANKIKDAFDKAMQLKSIKDEWLSILYNKDFALYTVIAHLTANMNSQSDAVWTYNVSSAIGTVALNLPDGIYNQMFLTDVGDIEWERRIKGFSKIRDKGFCFYNLLKNLIDKQGKNKYSLDALLKCSGLPSRKKLEEQVIQSMEANMTHLIEGPFKKNALDIIKKGIEVFKIRGIDGRKSGFRERLNNLGYKPITIFGDTYFDDTDFNFVDTLSKLESGKELTIKEHYLLYSYYDKKFKEFVNACGV